MAPQLRTLLALVVGFGTVGLAAELLLLGHTEDAPQWIPLALLAPALPVVAWTVRRPSVRSVRALTTLASLMIVGGVVGLALHYKGNAEFEAEMYPDRRGWELFTESLQGATPALAPASLIQLGLLGLVLALGSKTGERP